MFSKGTGILKKCVLRIYFIFVFYMSNCENSNILFEKLFLSSSTIDECPPEVTRDMLLHELMCDDLEAAGKEIMGDINKLWGLFYYINRGSNNEFGFTFVGEEVSIPVVAPQIKNRKTSVRNNNNKSSVKVNTNNSTKRASTKRASQKGDTIKRNISTKPQTKTRKRNWYDSVFVKNGKPNNIKPNNIKPNNIKPNNRGLRRLLFGGNNQFNENKKGYITLLNDSIEVSNENFKDLAPTWINNSVGGTTTLVKLKPVNNRTRIYVVGSSLPVPDTYVHPKSFYPKQYCANTLSFYKYIKNVSRIISLQGCNLDWNSITLPPDRRLPFRPLFCDGVDEKINWDTICKSIDPQYDSNNSSFHEYYWVDMTPGFFETYKSIVSMDFTKPENKTLVHCYAGKGRTGTVLLMILSRYYFMGDKGRENFEYNFNTGYFGMDSESKQAIRSYDLCKYLELLLTSHLQYDPIEPNSGGDMKFSCIEMINASIKRNNHKNIINELFHGFYERRTHTNTNVTISITMLNMLITRLNYIIYFTAYVNKIPFILLYQPYNTQDKVDKLNVMLRGINVDNVFTLPLRFPKQVMVKSLESMNVNNISPEIFGMSHIIPRSDYVEPQRVFSDDPKGDERPSSNERPVIDVPLHYTESPFTARHLAKRQSQNIGVLYDVEI